MNHQARNLWLDHYVGLCPTDCPHCAAEDEMFGDEEREPRQTGAIRLLDMQGETPY